MLEDDGRIFPPSEWPEDVHAAVKSYDVVTKNVTAGDRDTPFGEEILDIPEAQAEPVVEPDGVTDDLRGEIGIRDSWATGSSSAYCPVRAST